MILISKGWGMLLKPEGGGWGGRDGEASAKAIKSGRGLVLTVSEAEDIHWNLIPSAISSLGEVERPHCEKDEVSFRLSQSRPETHES